VGRAVRRPAHLFRRRVPDWEDAVNWMAFGGYWAMIFAVVVLAMLLLIAGGRGRR
jgi:hypothetical protein